MCNFSSFRENCTTHSRTHPHTHMVQIIISRRRAGREITSVNNFCFFTNISEIMLPTDMYYISLERSFYSASACVCCIKIQNAEIKALLQVKDWSFYIQCCLCFLTAFSHFLIKYSCYLTHKSYKMVDNKSKTSLIRHIQKNISPMKIFICDVFFLYMSFGKFSYYKCLFKGAIIQFQHEMSIPSWHTTTQYSIQRWVYFASVILII